MPRDVTGLFHEELASLSRFVEKQREHAQTIVVAYGWPASEAVIPIAAGDPAVIAMGIGVALAKVSDSELAAGMAARAVQMAPAIGGQGHDGYFHMERTAALLLMIDDVRSRTPDGVNAFFAVSKGLGAPAVGLGGETGPLFTVLLFACARLFAESPGSRADVLQSLKRAATMPHNPLQRWN